MAEKVRQKPATWEDIAALPEGENVEIIAGEISATPRSRPRHGRAQMVVSRDVGGPFDIDGDPGGWWIVVEPEIELSRHDVYIPDLAGWRRERVPVLPEDVPLRIVPDWVCEVVSPSTGRRDRVAKAHGYLRAGVPFYWLLDLEARLLEALAARDGFWLRLGAWTDGDRARIPPFDAIELAVGRFFPPLQ
ncbi:MAG: Uma2 family endonuclease [Acidobacteriota bacterium]